MVSTNVFTRSQKILSEYIRGYLNDLDFMERNEDKKKLTEFVLSVTHDFRLHTLFTIDDANQLWEVIRTNDNITDFVLKMTTHFFHRLEDGDREALIDKLSTNATLDISSSKHSYWVIDSTLKERLPRRDFLKNILENNSWLVALFVISLTPFTELFNE